MRVKHLLLRLAALAAILAFLFEGPPMILSQLDRDYFGEWAKPAQSEWKGVINLMNVYTDARFDSDALAKAVKLYERRNRGAFISHSTVPKDALFALLLRKAEQDIWIFPEGYTESGPEDIVITLPKPPEDNVIVEQFEFDVDEPDAEEPQEERVWRFVVSVRAEGEKGEHARAFAQLLFELADTSG